MIKIMTKGSSEGKAIGFLSLVFLLILFGTADWFAFYHVWRGWSPLSICFDNLPVLCSAVKLAFSQFLIFGPAKQ